MEVDSAFIRGASHIICQDYAVSGKNQNSHYAIIADGCSVIRNNEGSTPHPYSDLSARLVAYCAKEILYEFRAYGDGMAIVRSDFISVLRSKLTSLSQVLGLNHMIGDATLNLAYHYQGIIVNLMLGDGVVVVETETEWIIKVRQFQPNMPYYISYMLDATIKKRYEAANVVATETEYIIDKETNGMRESSATKPATMENSLDIYHADAIKSITVMSDGIEDLRQGFQIPLVEAVFKLLPFKSYKGLFVKRRLRAFERILLKEGITPNDDIAVATIAM